MMDDLYPPPACRSHGPDDCPWCPHHDEDDEHGHPDA